MRLFWFPEKSKKRKRAAAEQVDDYNEDSVDTFADVDETGTVASYLCYIFCSGG